MHGGCVLLDHGLLPILIVLSRLENKSANTSGDRVVSCEYLLTGLQENPVFVLDSKGGFLLCF